MRKEGEKLGLAPFIKHVKKFEAQTKAMTELKKTQQKVHEDKFAVIKGKFEETQNLQKEAKDKHRAKMFRLEKRMKE